MEANDKILADELAKLVAARNELRAARPDTVDIRLPIDKNMPSTLLVSVGSRRFNIERGKTVRVPYAVAQVIEQSARQDEELRARIADYVDNPILYN